MKVIYTQSTPALTFRTISVLRISWQSHRLTATWLLRANATPIRGTNPLTTAQIDYFTRATRMRDHVLYVPDSNYNFNYSSIIQSVLYSAMQDLDPIPVVYTGIIRYLPYGHICISFCQWMSGGPCQLILAIHDPFILTPGPSFPKAAHELVLVMW